MPGPPKQFDRDAALMKAMDVFWRQGYEATSVEDLVNAVGINRSSMYATFGDKQSLFLHALRLYADRHLAQVVELIRGRGKPMSRLKRTLRQMAKQLVDGEFRGCFAGNTASELGASNPKAGEIVRAMMTRGLAVFKTVLDEAVACGELAPRTDTARLAAFILTFLQGINVTSQATCAADEVNRLVESLIRAVSTGDFT